MDLRLEQADVTHLDHLVEMNRRLIEDERYDRPLPPDRLVERWRGFFDGKHKVFLFCSGLEVTGYCVIHDDQQPKYIRHFYVKQEYRRKGVGRQAFDLLLQALAVDEIDLDVMQWNAGGIAFWKALGFSERFVGMTYRK